MIRTGGRTATEGPINKVYVFWLPGMSCDGCTVATLGATDPGPEELLTGALPGVPVVVLHHYQQAMESGDHFTITMERAETGELEAPYVVVYEGSITDENLTMGAEPWAAEGALPTWAPAEERRRISTPEWVRRLAPGAAVTIAIGTCATWGGIPASLGNPTGAMSLMDFLGQDYRSKLGLPVINVPGCPPIGDNFTETVALLLRFINGQGPLPDFDELGRPTWQFGDTVHVRCPRGAWYEEGKFAREYGGKECLAEIGCWGPVVNCNITERGYVDHKGGCMVAGGACIGCTMPGFPDKFTPFYKRPPFTTPASTLSRLHGTFVTPLRRVTQLERNREPRWRDRVPSGWAPEYDRVTLFHRVFESFYLRIQYFRSDVPGRQKDVEKYASGYVTPPEAAYGDDYAQELPERREELARQRGTSRRRGLTPQVEGFDTPLDEES
ncbi:MAG: hydrogenase expression protein HypE [Actinobacteria bacterium]|nr:hydrogenase expression protein HypE [Actinomycetota bacterium]